MKDRTRAARVSRQMRLEHEAGMLFLEIKKLPYLTMSVKPEDGMSMLPNTSHWLKCYTPISTCPIFPGDTKITWSPLRIRLGDRDT